MVHAWSMTDQEASPLAAGRRRSPSRLVLVRHAQSVGNVADELAHARGLGRLELDTRDADTPLSDLGEEQARALGRHLLDLPESERPQVVVTSPYQRARRTAEIALQTAGLEHTLIVDERLRERDLGVLDGYTRKGIEERFPEEADRRTRVGKLYYRPAGGESWCDVALRVRSVLGDLRSEYDSERVWLFSHQAVIMSFRLVLESLDEEALLREDRENPVPNVSMTTYEPDDAGALVLVSYGVTSGDGPTTVETPVGEGTT